jgi:hypothetical protein
LIHAFAIGAPESFPAAIKASRSRIAFARSISVPNQCRNGEQITARKLDSARTRALSLKGPLGRFGSPDVTRTVIRYHIDLDEVIVIEIAARPGSQDDFVIFAADHDMSAAKLHVGEWTISTH